MASSGYASRLKEYAEKGVCGLPERLDTQRLVKTKLRRLVKLLQASKHTVLLTGAGISTSAGIPDFRGPNGIWTAELDNNNNNKKKKRKRPPDVVVTNFAQARPTVTHDAIVKLVSLRHVHYVITQNVDGLHRRSGLSRAHHSVLHGCVFTETCRTCETEHFRDYDVGGMSFQPTGRTCDVCKTGKLHDTLLDWEDPLPEEDLERSLAECEKADLVIALGTSLRIEPAGSMPTQAKKFVIVNLQETPYDDGAEIVIRAKVDEIMKGVMEQLGYANWDTEVDKKPEIERLWKRPTAPSISK